MGTRLTWDENSLGIKHTPVEGFMPLHQIIIPDNRKRDIPAEELNDLAQSIKDSGLLQRPAVNRVPGVGHVLVAGYNRLRALELIGHADSVPVRIFRELTDDQAEYLHLAENVYRSELDEQTKAAQAKRATQLTLSREEEKRTKRQEQNRKSLANKREEQSSTHKAAAATDCVPNGVLHGWSEPTQEASGWKATSLKKYSARIHEKAGVDRRRGGRYPAEVVAKLVEAAVLVKAEVEEEKLKKVEEKKRARENAKQTEPQAAPVPEVSAAQESEAPVSRPTTPAPAQAKRPKHADAKLVEVFKSLKTALDTAKKMGVSDLDMIEMLTASGWGHLVGEDS